MKPLRVSATDIDALRYFEANEDASLDALISQLRRESAPSEAMLAGSALHSALENAEPGEIESIHSGDYTFDMRIEGEVALPDIREMKATREYRSGDHLVTLVGKVDAVLGLTVVDHKFTSRFDPDRFLNSMQWRIYLEVFGAEAFVWNIFEGREIGPKHYVINHLHVLKAHSYPEMGADVQRAVDHFVDFACWHLPERFA